MVRRAALTVAVTVSGFCALVLLGATALAVVPSEPRDRAAPRLVAPDDRPIRITVLGTSLSSGGRYRWPDEVARQLGRRLNRPVEVRRVTQPGGTSAWAETQVRVVSDSEPDIVLVELAINDADLRRHQSLRSSARHHQRILTDLLASRPGTAVILLTMNPASGPRGWARPFLSRYYAEYVDLAQRYDTGLLDLFARWSAMPSAEREIADGLHPSDAAATAVIVAPLVDALATSVQG